MDAAQGSPEPDPEQDPEPNPEEERTDYRYLLANERTFLAYVRTAIALQVAGLGVLQFLTSTSDWARYLLGVALVFGGSYVAISGHLRTRRNERAMRSGADIRPGSLSVVLVAAVAAIPLVAAAAMALT